MRKILGIIFILLSLISFSQVHLNDTIRIDKSQKDSLSISRNKSDIQVFEDIKASNAPEKITKYNPTKAGLYSAVLPGLGQFYNKKYWKIPIVWGAVGTGVGIALWNQKQYKRYRNAFVAELNGQPHEFSDINGVTAEVLGNTQDRAKRQRDYAIAIAGLIYILNIVDAVVDAHLYEGRHDPDLALQPAVIYDEYAKKNAKTGLSLTFRF